MPISFKVDVPAGIVRGQGLGQVSTPDVLQALGEMVDNPGYESGMGVLWDLRGADLSSLDSESLRSIQAWNLQHKGDRGSGRVAFVIDTELGFGIGRMHQVLGETPHLRIQVFRELEKAEEWLCAG